MATNLVILTGRTGKDAEVRHLEGGIAVARVALATSKYYKDKQGQRQEKTQWHNIVAWRNTAEFLEKYVPKGSQITVIGEIEYEEYEKNGEKRYSTKIVAQSVDLIVKGGQTSDSGNGNGYTNERYQNQPANNHGNQNAPTFYSSDADNDLPF